MPSDTYIKDRLSRLSDPLWRHAVKKIQYNVIPNRDWG